MTEPVKRNSTRERKPNRFLQQDELQVVNSSGPRGVEHREMRTNTSQTTQLARLLLNFIQSINSKYRDYAQEQHKPANSLIPNNPIPPPPNPNRPTRTSERAPNNNDQPLLQTNRRADTRRTGYDENSKTNAKSVEKKKGDSNKQTNFQNTNFDQDFTTLVANAVKNKPNTQTDPNNPPNAHSGKANPQKSQQKLRLGQSKGGIQKDQKKTSALLQPKTQQLKPFKRQSYHVAIAYHIHLKKLRPNQNSNTNEIDPTYNARRLREQQERR